MSQLKRKSRPGFQLEKLEGRTLLAGWSTIDTYRIDPTGFTGVNTMTTDRAGNLYVAYQAVDSTGAQHAVIRQKTAAGVWSTIEDLTNANIGGLATDRGGNLFTAGWVGDGSGNQQWSVMERAAGANTFSVIDTDPSNAGAAISVAVDNAGDVFASGQISADGLQSHWIVRKLTTGTTTFSTVDDFNYVSSGFNQPNGITVVAGGKGAGIYVVGSGGLVDHWLVRKSTDGGTTWATVDDYQFDPNGFGTIATAVAADPSGNIYVVGEGDSDSSDWLVRKSTDGGATWTVNDDFNLSSSTFGQATASAIAADSAGNMYVIGIASDSDDTPHSIVRTNAFGGWSTIDDFQPGGGAWGYAFAVDRAGNLFSGSAVQSTSSSFVDDGVVRLGHLVSTLTPSGTSIAGISTIAVSGVVGSFTTTDGSATASNFTATINWGDGHVSNGTVAFNSSTRQFDVTGANTFANGGTFAISVTIHASDSATTTINSTANITPRGPVPHLTTSGAAYEGSSFSITFASTDTDNLAITQWTINWGDGTTQHIAGSATTAAHIYADGFAAEQVIATATDQAGRSNGTNATVQVVDVPPTGKLTSAAPSTSGGLYTVQFSSVTDISSADIAAGFRYSFDFNNDGLFEISGSTVPSATIPAAYLLQPGPHVIRGRVFDKDGLYSEYTTTVNVPAAGAAVATDKTITVADSTQINAGTFFSSAGVSTGPDGGAWVGTGGWIGFSLDFSKTGIKRAKLQLRAAAALKGFKVAMYLDDPAGSLLATFSKGALSKNGQAVKAANVTGVHNVYLVVINGQAEMNWFSFELTKPKRSRGH